MYSNERGSRVSVLDILVKIVFFILFVLALYFLFPKVPNMTPFYSNVFRENISYMQEAGEAYFTDERMPKEIGDTVKITLSELFEKKLVLPFVDEDGNSCNQYESYVSVTKEEESKYSLKTNLVCNEETDYLIKILGCHTYCKDKECEKTCSKEQITMYQFKKAVSSTITSYSCASGYARKGNKCYKTYLKDTKTAVVTTVTDTIITAPPKITVIPGTNLELGVIRENLPSVTQTVYDTPDVKTTPARTETVARSCPSTSTERVCTTTYKTESYKCNCTTRTVNFKDVVSCDTCTRSIPVESCKNVSVTVPGTCYDTVTIPAKTTYSCPSISTSSSGSGSSLRCWHTKTVPGGTTTKCPLEATNYTGSGETLRCFRKTEGRTVTECTDKTYTLRNGICEKKITGTSTELKCKDSGYVLEGNVCNLYDTEKKDAKVSRTTKKSYKYTWSEKTSLSGWTKTGKFKTTEGKEICK